MSEVANTYGLWQVTTQGDSESRRIKQLGIHEGFVDEIAFELSGELEFYSLGFYRVELNKGRKLNTRESVNVVIEGSGADRFEPALKFFADRPVSVDQCAYFGAVTLKREITEEMKRDEKRALLRKALSAGGFDVDDVIEAFNLKGDEQ